MRRFADSVFGLVISALLSAVLAAAAFPVLGSDGLLAGETHLDFHYLAPWIVAGAVLLLLGRVAALAGKYLARHLSQSSSPAGTADENVGESAAEADADTGTDTGEDAGGDGRRLLKAAEVARALLGGAGLATLIAGLLRAVPELPATVSGYPGAPDLDSLAAHLEIFNSLATWTILVAAFFVAVRAATEIWSWLGEALPLPFKRLVALAGAYVLLADGGVLSVAFDFSRGLLIAILALALTLPYLASVARHAVASPLPHWMQMPARILLMLSEIGWIALLLGVMVSLPRVVDGMPEERYGDALEHIAPYLEILDTLAFWSIILLAPFIVVRVVAAFRPVVGEVFGFPMGRIILFGIALVIFSDKGVPATASSFPIPQLMPAMAVALIFSYLALVLRRVAQLGLFPRIAQLMTNLPSLAGSVMSAAGLSMVVWAILKSLPLVSAPILDNSLTSVFGEASLPYFAGLFEARYTLTAFFFVAILTLSLPDPLWSPARWRVRPMVTAVGFTASGCLLWMSGAQLSALGHVFLLIGAVIGVGLLSLGLCQLAAYVANSPEPLLSDSARWLIRYRQRGFLIGAAVAFYGMLLRPLMYEVLWFAEAYEWLAVLVVAIWAMIKIRGNLKTYVESEESAPSTWTGWSRHEQFFEDRPDPRWNLVSRWRQRFIESGEWVSLWTYLMGLLCRKGAPPESARDVFLPLRNCVASPYRGPFWRRGRKRAERLREAALAESLRSAERVLAGAASSPASIGESALSESAGQFIESGAEPEATAAALIGAYCQQGADLNAAINLWFPVVNMVNRSPRWFEPPWVRRHKRTEAQARRRRLVEGARSHLSGQGSLSSLAVAVAASRLPVYSTSSVNAPAVAPSGTIAKGQGFELLDENDHAYFVRTSENVVGYVYKSAIRRQPILPGDEVGITQ